MKWCIPAKTFLVGEYLAINKQPAIIITTTPYFTMTLNNINNNIDNNNDFFMYNQLHPRSPAGKFLIAQNFSQQLIWEDPYNGQGGLGASSAQFIGAYLANCYIHNITPDINSLCSEYYQYSWNGVGLRPSGYDIIAQFNSQCVYIDATNNIFNSYKWCFQDLAFILIHSGKKLATHEYLQNITLPSTLNQLTVIVEEARQAFITNNSTQLINAVNNYQKNLIAYKLVAAHTLTILQDLQQNKSILAAKGCGAFGADIIMILTESRDLLNLIDNFKKQNLIIIANSMDCITC